MNYCVYKHTAPNGKVYIGITGRDPIIRWSNGNGYCRQPYFFNAILKYGWDNFKHEIICEGLNRTQAEKMERELIHAYKSNDTHFGYNISVGGNSPALKYIKPLTCPTCGKTFHKKNKSSKYCSIDCRIKNKSHLIYYRGETHSLTEWSKILNIPAKTLSDREKRNLDLIKGGKVQNIKCPICNKEFKPKDKQSKYCSKPCQYEGLRGYYEKSEV